jgi:hypothetical protein
MLTLPLVLYQMRLGAYIHYWFAVLPFIFYWLSWGVSRGARGWRWVILVSCATSLMSVTGFLQTVHEAHGLRGEYGQAYSAQN